MKNKNLEVENNVKEKFLNNSLKKKLSKKCENIIQDMLIKINKKDNFYNIFDENLKFNFSFRELKRFKKYKHIVIIGMGGSILSAEAINDFLKRKIIKKIYFLNDLNSESIFKLKKQKTEKTLFIVISKSGNTTETLLNLVSLDILKKNSKNIIIISENKNNHLRLLSKQFNLFYVEHKSFIGGRYSVFSEVGMLPSYLMGIKLNLLRKNLKKYFYGKEKKFLKESSVMLANILLRKKKRNLIFLNYEPSFEKFLYWCQQLIAESLGKKKTGFLPVISNNPKDHHSLLQLYLDGPRDKLFHIFSIDNKFEKKFSTKKIKNLNHLNNKSINKVKIAQKDSLIQVFKKKQIPYREFKIKKDNEETLGELFIYFIIETIIVGKLIDVDPFNQPAVEQVKVITNKLLK